MSRIDQKPVYDYTFIPAVKSVKNIPIKRDDTERVLIIDADSMLHMALYKIEELELMDNDGFIREADDEEQWREAKFRIRNKLQEITNNVEEWYNIKGMPFLFVGGKGNFRYNIYSEYKANRKSAELPKFFKELKEYCINELKWFKVDGYEADDAMYSAYLKANGNCIAAYIDKDLKGFLHCPYYNYRSYGDTIGEFGNIEPKEGHYLFAIQCIMGDAGDNIKGIPGIGPKKAEKLVHPDMTTKEYIKAVYDAYIAYYKDAKEAKKQAKLNYTLLRLHNINK